MVDGGIKDILIANQIVGTKKIAALMKLCQRADAICVACDNGSNLQEISQAAAKANVTVHVLVDINIGMDRCGIHWSKHSTIVELCRLASTVVVVCFVFSKICDS
jgi:D-serine deaminase-like pyridoxal phosphate-dependent protein